MLVTNTLDMIIHFSHCVSVSVCVYGGLLRALGKLGAFLWCSEQSVNNRYMAS